MGISSVIIFLGVIVLLSHLFTYFFDKIRVPNVLLLMIIGILFGPLSGVVKLDDFGKVGPVFSNLTLLLILFESGANLKLEGLLKSLRGASIITVIIFAGTVSIIAVLTHFLAGLDWVSAAMTGAVLGGTSSAIVIPMIRQIKMGENSKTLLLMESALSDVLCLITGLSLFSAMKSGTLEMRLIIKDIGVNFFISIVLGVASGLFWSFLLQHIRKMQNSLFITAAYLFIIYGIAEYFEFNGGITALMLGITLGNIGLFSHYFEKYLDFHPSPVDDVDKRFFGEIVFIFSTYFFVYIGIAMQFSHVNMYLIAALITASLYVLRYGVVRLIIRSDEMKPDRGIIFSVGPKGLVPAILASLPLQAGLAGGEKIQDIVFAVIFLSIVVSSALVYIQQIKKGRSARLANDQAAGVV